jgi:23S rRNA (cytosine1962-C5)-methyltransferase
MPLTQAPPERELKLQLSRDLTRTIKRGHSWVYHNALRELPKVAAGTSAILIDNRGGKEIARGFYDPDGSIALRICSTRSDEHLNDQWAERRMSRALNLRQLLFDEKTTGYRLFNGEGDGLPGLVCDIYSRSAVLKLDGIAAENFWEINGICEWLNANIGIGSVFLKRKGRQEEAEAIYGKIPAQPVPFLENGIKFTADLIMGQKTGFYFDQRDNRARMKNLAVGKKVLNTFGYTGGFSVYAGLGNAIHVATVDLAKPALAAAEKHWVLNNLDPDKHETIAADVFEFLDYSVKDNMLWDLVILDPPSFAPSESALPQALNAYQKMVFLAAKTTQANGLLAVSSCSSHVTQAQFIKSCEEGISKTRRRATIIGIHGLPADHPTPLVMSELRYLKFLLMQLD